jgi:hypothetical protein
MDKELEPKETGIETEKKGFPPGVGMSLGISIGAGMGVALGLAMNNIPAGIAIGMGSGVSIGAAVEAAAKKEREGIDDPPAKKQKKLAYLSLGLGILAVISLLMYFLVGQS